MATTFVLLNKEAKGFVPLYVRVQYSTPKINIRVKTPLSVPAEKWNADRGGVTWKNYSRSEDGKAVLEKCQEMQAAIDSQISAGMIPTADGVKKICEDIYYAEQRKQAELEAERKRRAEEEANRMTLAKYIDMYLAQIASGARQTDKGTNYSANTVKAVRTAMEQWKAFQKHQKKVYDFDDIDIQVYHDYTAWLKTEVKDKNGKVLKQAYSINSIGKCISNLKVILEAARSEKYHKNLEYTDKKFKSTRVEVDAIYLPKEDLEKLMAVDCSKVLATCRAMEAGGNDIDIKEDKENGKGYELARDIFLVGCWTAQRVSDYNNISRDQIETYTRKFISQEPDPANPGKMRDVIKTEDKVIINIRQQKTKAKVAIPCSTQLLEILKKYDFQLPHLTDQTVNDYIKMVAMAAGLTEKVEILTTVGGTPKREFVPKYKLIHTHTARRTGATLMYLSGMDIYDIMKITGHTSPATLKKYIRANELEVVDKIVDKYSYFD